MRVKMERSVRIDDLATTYRAGSVYEVESAVGRQMIREGAAIECGPDNEPLSSRQPQPKPSTTNN